MPDHLLIRIFLAWTLSPFFYVIRQFFLLGRAA